MNTHSEFDRHASAWLADGPTELADRVLDAALREVYLTHQRRRWSTLWRTRSMNIPIRLAAALAVGVIAVGGALYIIGPRPGPGGPTLVPTGAAPSPTTSATSVPTGPIDTSDWIPFASTRYGFNLSFPPGWTAKPADHDWTWDGDGKNWLSTGADAFVATGRAIRVSAWTVPLEAGQTIESWADVEAWAVRYCERTGNTPCSGMHDRIMPLCIEKRDCHPALLVPFAGDVHAFGAGGVLPGGMLVVAVWWEESASAVAPYGGATRLLEGFLSTMEIWPTQATYPDHEEAAATFLATGQ